MKPSGNDNVHHEGNCGDCNGSVDTRVNGATIHQDKLMAIDRKTAVFLICISCANKREGRNYDEWMPGKFHKPLEIKVFKNGEAAS